MIQEQAYRDQRLREKHCIQRVPMNFIWWKLSDVWSDVFLFNPRLQCHVHDSRIGNETKYVALPPLGQWYLRFLSHLTWPDRARVAEIDVRADECDRILSFFWGDEYDNKNKMRVFRRRPRARVRLDDYISLSTPKNRRASIRHSLLPVSGKPYLKKVFCGNDMST